MRAGPGDRRCLMCLTYQADRGVVHDISGIELVQAYDHIREIGHILCSENIGVSENMEGVRVT